LPRPPQLTPNQDIGIDTKQIDQIMAQTGKVNAFSINTACARDEISDWQ
jgi:hypothetical protein